MCLFGFFQRLIDDREGHCKPKVQQNYPESQPGKMCGGEGIGGRENCKAIQPK